MTRDEAARMVEAVVKPTFGAVTKCDNHDAYHEAFLMAIAALREPEWVRTTDRLPDGNEHDDVLGLYKGLDYLMYDIVQIGWFRLQPELYVFWMRLPEKPEVEG